MVIEDKLVKNIGFPYPPCVFVQFQLGILGAYKRNCNMFLSAR